MRLYLGNTDTASDTFCASCLLCQVPEEDREDFAALVIQRSWRSKNPTFFCGYLGHFLLDPRLHLERPFTQLTPYLSRSGAGSQGKS
jgi:hypothetical protein